VYLFAVLNLVRLKIQITNISIKGSHGNSTSLKSSNLRVLSGVLGQLSLPLYLLIVDTPYVFRTVLMNKSF
jgi:hypothetical protein